MPFKQGRSLKALAILTALLLTGCGGKSSSPSSPTPPTPPTPSTPAPTVTAITPSSGLTTGGTAVTITGTNFTEGATVTIAGVAATAVTVVSATSITAKTGAGNAGTGDVVVTVKEGGQAGRLFGGFTYRSQLVVTTYYGGGEPNWSLFYGVKVPNGGAAQDPLGQKGVVWELRQMGQMNGGWWPLNLMLSSPTNLPYEQFQSWSTDVMLWPAPPPGCPTLRFNLDYHGNVMSSSAPAGVMLDLHPDGTFWAKGAWSITRTGEVATLDGPRVSFARWYNIRMDIRVLGPDRAELEYFLDGRSFGKQVPPAYFATDAIRNTGYRDIVFWGCGDTKAYLANMRAAM